MHSKVSGFLPIIQFPMELGITYDASRRENGERIYLMDGNTVLWAHLVKLINAHHTIISQHHCTTLQKWTVLSTTELLFTLMNLTCSALQYYGLVTRMNVVTRKERVGSPQGRTRHGRP